MWDIQRDMWRLVVSKTLYVPRTRWVMADGVSHSNTKIVTKQPIKMLMVAEIIILTRCFRFISKISSSAAHAVSAA